MRIIEKVQWLLTATLTRLTYAALRRRAGLQNHWRQR
jgi:hypothetical protein